MNELSPFFKALCEDVRLKIITLLMPRELCVCEIIAQLNLSQPAVSHHMKILKQAGLVNDRRDGRWIFYSLDKERFMQLERLLDEQLFEPVRKCPSESGSIPNAKCRL